MTENADIPTTVGEDRHLPECQCDYSCVPYCGDCVCDALRACEQRVREEESRNVIGSVSLAAIGEANVQQYHLGFAAALNAAREAIRNREDGEYFPWVQVEIATAAIDALRATNQ